MTRDRYDAYVEHPRFGKRPRLTGLNPESDMVTGKPFLHWNATARIANTAVAADLSKQSRATVAVTHYYDVNRTCRDCGRPFIFFAEEQKHWYEELGLPLEADCVRCVPCRKAQQGLARKHARYQELFHFPQRTTEQSLEMAECCLTLIEAGEFHARQAQRVRELLNHVDKHGDAPESAQALRKRLADVEA